MIAPLSVLLLLAAPVQPATAPQPARADTRPRAPEVTVHGFRVVAERVAQQQSFSLEFPTDAAGAPKADGKRTGRQAVTVHLAIYPPDPKQINQIDSLTPHLVAYTPANTAVSLRSFQYDETSPEAAGVWRAQVVAQELDPDVQRLQRLHGELLVYPRARKASIELPLAGKAPHTGEVEGFHVTVKSVRQAPSLVTAVVEVQYPSDLNVSYPNPEMPGGIAAVTPVGTTVVPGSSSTSGTDKNGTTTRVYSVTFTEMRELPAKIRVEALLRTGTPQKVPFTLPDIPLPDAFRDEIAADEEADADVLERGHPLYAAKGGTLEAPVAAGQAGKGRLMIGLSRQESGEWGPWRWLEIHPANGRAVIAHLRAGRYRVSRAWRPDGAANTPMPEPARGAAQEVDVTAGGTVRLPVTKGAGQ